MCSEIGFDMWLQKLAKLPERLFGRTFEQPRPFAHSEPEVESVSEPKVEETPIKSAPVPRVRRTSEEKRLILEAMTASEDRVKELLNHPNMEVRLEARKRLAIIRWSFGKDRATAN